MKNNWQPWAKARRRRAGLAAKKGIYRKNVGTPAKQAEKEEESTAKRCHPAKEETGGKRRRKEERKELRAKAKKAAKAKKEVKEEERQEPKVKDRQQDASSAEGRTGKQSVRKEEEKASGR